MQNTALISICGVHTFFLMDEMSKTNGARSYHVLCMDSNIILFYIFDNFFHIFMYIYSSKVLKYSCSGRLYLRSLRVDLGICILLRWIQVLGCMLDYKSFRSVRVDALRLLPKQKQKTIVTQPSTWCDVIRDYFE